MTTDFSLNSFVKEHRLTLFDVVVLSILESMLFVAQFYFMGKAINDLIQKSWQGIYILIGLFVVKIIISYIKQIRITKAYNSIYDKLITRTVVDPLSAGVAPESIAPRSSIIFVIADFFKSDLIRGIETLARLFFVLISLFLLNKTIFLACLALALIVFILYRIQRSRTINLSEQLAQELKTEFSIIKERNVEALYKHHKKTDKLDKGLLNISSINLSIIEILSLILIVFSLVVLVETQGENAIGTFFVMLYYVMTFSEGMFLLPSIYQKYLKLQQMSLLLK